MKISIQARNLLTGPLRPLNAALLKSTRFQLPVSQLVATQISLALKGTIIRL